MKAILASVERRLEIAGGNIRVTGLDFVPKHDDSTPASEKKEILDFFKKFDVKIKVSNGRDLNGYPTFDISGTPENVKKAVLYYCGGDKSLCKDYMNDAERASVHSHVEVAEETGGWFDALSDNAKISYLKKHPDSKFAGRRANGATGVTHLHNLIQRKDGAFLLNHPSVAKLQDNVGTTPLHLAARVHKESFEHPDIDKPKDMDGRTPLHYGAQELKEALKHPSVSKVKDKEGNTPLHEAAASYYPPVGLAAIKHPDAAKVKDADGRTPLHHARLYGADPVKIAAKKELDARKMGDAHHFH